MTVQELMDWLARLPVEARQKPVCYQRTTLSQPHEIDHVDYDLTTVALRA